MLSLNISIFCSCNFLISVLDRLFLPTSIINFVPLNKLKFNEESKFFFVAHEIIQSNFSILFFLIFINLTVL